ncbi:hypothetical protein CRP01_23990 [Flavilitoribacter nigricans DSM 23189 = NBRC 102662]|uniref:Uncharacterized protein n=1 Tax=Flavilitoribacter nigricans (strain ATCC 23147 / DSM 23189 / NBRC 102662 / NCIMB 1420 / SS-2) TaxID=1122177 RepID=A0A2D0N606_FLAN2|nr:hypothetical protein CRP01_23990 [Flavilitoribacter nigricans DSM 23189 = NBRC 102662]
MKEVGKGLKADVVFGSPTNRCVGIGICQVNPYQSTVVSRHLSCCQRVETTLHFSQPDRLIFSFSRKKICKKMIGRQFAYSRFRIKDALELSDWLTDQLGTGKAELIPGTYPVIFEEEWISVAIRIRQS